GARRQGQHRVRAAPRRATALRGGRHPAPRTGARKGAMNELSKEAKAIIEGGLPGDEPSAADHARVRARVAARLAAGGAVALSGATASAASATGVGAKIVAAFGGKVGLAVLALAGTGTVYSVRAILADEPQPAAPIAAEGPPSPAA